LRAGTLGLAALGVGLGLRRAGGTGLAVLRAVLKLLVVIWIVIVGPTVGTRIIVGGRARLDSAAGLVPLDRAVPC
jgi:hypothetical protein